MIPPVFILVMIIDSTTISAQFALSVQFAGLSSETEFTN